MPVLLIILIISFIIISFSAFYFRKNKTTGKLRWSAYILFLILLIEFTCAAGFYFKTGKLIYRSKPNPNFSLFKPHPYLVAVPRKNVTLTNNGKTITHNSSGFRGKEFSAEKKIPRIIAIGGSTTYGVAVSDNETWPYYLDSLQNGRSEVLNFGVPGYTTVEMLIQSELFVQDYKPDIVLIHAGLNDMRNYNVDSLERDYSNYHAPSYYASMGFCYNSQLPNCASLMFLVMLMQQINLYPKCPFHQMYVTQRKNNSIDSTALKLYERNLHSLISFYKNRNIKVLLIPQVLNYDAFKTNIQKWIPFIPLKDISETMKIYNSITKNAGDEEHVLFAENILKTDWGVNDFADHTHLNANANRRFAGIINSCLENLK